MPEHTILDIFSTLTYTSYSRFVVSRISKSLVVVILRKKKHVSKMATYPLKSGYEAMKGYYTKHYLRKWTTPNIIILIIIITIAGKTVFLTR
jgi:hypothetical protein